MTTHPADKTDATDALPDVAKPDPKAKTEARIATEWALSPIYGSTVVAHAFAERLVDGTGWSEAIDVVADAAEAVNRGDLSQLEAMVVGHALALHSQYVALSQLAAPYIGRNIYAAAPYLRLALKAQAQSLAAIETLARLKHPRPVVAVQVNTNVETAAGDEPQGEFHRTNY